MQERLDLQRLTSAILRRWFVVLAATALIAALGYVISRAQPSTYEATTSVLVGQEPPGVIIENSDRATKEQLALTFAAIALRAPVLEPSAATLGITGSWQSLRSRVTIELAPRTLLLDLSVTGRSPESAARAADVIADQLVALTETLSPYRQVKVGPARANSEPVGPDVPMNTLFAGIIGFIAASAVALVVELARERGRRSFRPQDDVPFLGHVRAERGAVPTVELDEAATEQGAAILGNLRVACGSNPLRVIVVTGTSTVERARVATQLAATLSLEGVSTVLVDFGLRHPVLHHVCGIPIAPGVADVLEERAPRDGSLHSVRERLAVMPAGRASVNPALLLSADAADRIVAAIGPSAEAIVIDLPLTRRTAEAALAAERADALVLVIRSRITRTEERHASDDLAAIGVLPTGIVVVHRSLLSRLLRSPATAKFDSALRAGTEAEGDTEAEPAAETDVDTEPEPEPETEVEAEVLEAGDEDGAPTLGPTDGPPAKDKVPSKRAGTSARRVQARERARQQRG